MNFYNKTVTFRENIPNINNYLIIALGFFLPISVSIPLIILGVILLLWCYEGRFTYKYKIIKSNPINYTFLAFFIIQVLGLLWTQDMAWGLHIVGKEWRMLLPLVLMTIVKQKYIKYYILSFLLGMSLSEVLSYLIFFKIIPPILHASLYDPTPFMGHISYNPFLAFSIFILIYLTFFEKTYANTIEKIVSMFFICTMSVNMFITGGRAGQVGFFVMLSLAIFLYFKKNILKSIIIILILIPIIFTIAYKTSTIFHNRADKAIANALNFKQNPTTSVGQRLTFLVNSLRIVRENPIFGVGTGDFPSEYQKVNKKYTPKGVLATQPQNMYLLELTQLGLLGFISLLSIFYMQIKIALENNKLAPLRLALPILFLVIMLSDVYLLSIHGSLLFVYFSSFLYNNFKNEKN